MSAVSAAPAAGSHAAKPLGTAKANDAASGCIFAFESPSVLKPPPHPMKNGPVGVTENPPDPVAGLSVPVLFQCVPSTVPQNNLLSMSNAMPTVFPVLPGPVLRL